MMSGRNFHACVLVSFFVPRVCGKHCQGGQCEGENEDQSFLQIHKAVSAISLPDNYALSHYQTNTDDPAFYTTCEDPSMSPITTEEECKKMTTDFIGGWYSGASDSKYWPPGCFRYPGVNGMTTFMGTNQSAIGNTGHVLVCQGGDEDDDDLGANGELTTKQEARRAEKTSKKAAKKEAQMEKAAEKAASQAENGANKDAAQAERKAAKLAAQASRQAAKAARQAAKAAKDEEEERNKWLIACAASVDDDVCLREAVWWGDSATCANSEIYCTGWSKDMHRCCPTTCKVDPVCDEDECNALSGFGACRYPPKPSRMIPCGDGDDNVCLQQSPAWGLSSTCAGNEANCHAWNKDMHRCCPTTCNVDPVCDEFTCNALSSYGTCTGETKGNPASLFETDAEEIFDDDS